MYRSFVTCDDPKGVIECGTIRKSRTGQKVEDKTKSQRTAKNLDKSLAKIPEKEQVLPKGSTEKSCDPSSLQLMEISRGAQRLNNMVGSWSGGLRYDLRTEDIAKELLKGALDLQESLVMLRQFQEASQHKARLKKKQNERLESERIDAEMADRIRANQFGGQSYPMGFQKHRLSTDVSFRSSTEELKKVTRDSLARQSLLPSTSTEGLDSSSEVLSTSSSHSHSDKQSNSSFSSTASKKEKGPNLVAKLMGLEEFPSRPFPAAVQKQLEGEKILNQKRPIFEAEVPKRRKNNSIMQKVDSEHRRTLKEILETMHYKGLLRKGSVKESRLQNHNHSHLHSKQYDEMPPIVLIKPRCTPCQDVVEAIAPIPSEDLSMRKLKAEAIPSKAVKHKAESTKMGKRLEEDVIKRCNSEEKGPEDLKGVTKLDDKEVKHNERAPNKGKIYSQVCHKPHLGKTNDKKAKVKIISQKPPEKEISKPRIVAKSQDQGEMTSKKMKKPQSGSRVNKNEIPCQQRTASNTTSKAKTQNNSKDQKKNHMKKQPVAEGEAAIIVAEQSGHEEEKGVIVPCKNEEEQRIAVSCKEEEENRIVVPCKDEEKTIFVSCKNEEEKRIIVSCKDDYTEFKTATALVYEIPMEDVADAYIAKMPGGFGQIPSSPMDVMLLRPEHEFETTAGEAHNNISCNETDKKDDKEGAELKYLLLTSESFIGHAEKLLNIDVDCPMVLQKHKPKEIANFRVYLDIANEVTERKSLQESQIVRPLLPTCAGNSRLHSSLGQLVEEIYNVIENLKFYSEISGEKLSVDSLYAMMERDIKCNGLPNAIWEWGWKHGFSADEAEEVVNEVESLVLTGLIEEVLT